jgi:hypothetical protein
MIRCRPGVPATGIAVGPAAPEAADFQHHLSTTLVVPSIM